jgi:hypothetical protein
MTAWVRTDCPDCGSLYLPARDVAAWMMLPTLECSYSFSCLHCRQLVERPCSTNTLEQLARCGVILTTVIVPDEAEPPLSEAEAEAFSQLLADDDAFTRAVRRLGVG